MRLTTPVLRVANTKSFRGSNAQAAGLGGRIAVNARNSFPIGKQIRDKRTRVRKFLRIILWVK